jgi:hypothetical protein
MLRPGFLALALVLLSLSACGGAPEPAASPEAPAAAAAPAKPKEEAAAPAAEKAGPVEVPTTCTTTDGYCLPPPRFVKKLCSAFQPDLALAMFAKGTPWTRAYLKGDVDAVNASGGVSSNDKLVFDEEVLVMIRRKADAGGMQVSGAGDGFDVLRWDGTCATLSGGEITLTAPPKSAKNPKLKWQDLAETTQTKLLEDPKIAKINTERRKECKGVTMGEVSVKCVKAVDALSLAIVSWVRGGGTVPAPATLP